MSHIIVNKWSVLKDLKIEFVKSIKYVYVFGINGDQVIVITNDDNVYAFGGNSDGCLGLGHTDAVQQPTLIPELCQKQVIKIEFGAKNYVMALTKNGTVFSWGNNTYGQLANGNKTPHHKPIILSSLNDTNVIDIKTCAILSLALSSSGDTYISSFVYTYANNNYYHYNVSNITKMSAIPSNKIISIACGLYHALALTDNGDVYCWGDYAKGKKMDNLVNGNLSIRCYYTSEDASNFMIFTKNTWSKMQNLSDICVTKIACGPYHCLLLSKKGNVFCFGANNFEQCGDAINENKIAPTKINSNLNFIDIGATKNYDISVGLAENGFCYVWGKCGEYTSDKPIKTTLKTIIDALEFYSPTHLTYAPLKPSNIQNSLIMERISEKFNKRENSDVAFKVDDKIIYAQKTHLINVCKHFEAMFADKNWIESQINEIEITNYSYSVYFAFIRYLYTDCVDVTPDESIAMLDLANCYLDAELKKRCAKIIKSLISIENVIALYFSAVKYDCDELKKYCVDYFHINISDKSIINNALENAAKEFVK